MDKTLEIVIAASVILMTAASIMFMVSDRAGSFGQWSNDTQTGAECSSKKHNSKTPATALQPDQIPRQQT
jgi:hypothetical protein